MAPDQWTIAKEISVQIHQDHRLKDHFFHSPQRAANYFRFTPAKASSSASVRVQNSLA